MTFTDFVLVGLVGLIAGSAVGFLVAMFLLDRLTRR